jgi:hypothetical protein
VVYNCNPSTQEGDPIPKKKGWSARCWWLNPIILVTPSYSGGRNQEDHGSKPAWPYLKKTLHKKGLVEWLNVQALSSSPGTTKIKKIKKRVGRLQFSGRACLARPRPWVPFHKQVNLFFITKSPNNHNFNLLTCNY